MIRSTKRLARFTLWTLLLLSPLASSDPRQTYSASSPAYLRAVGQLIVPSQSYRNGEQRAYREYCTATLVDDDLILTGWHCLEAYRDLSRTILFTLPNLAEPLQRRAWRLESGGSMERDWALLRLDRPIRAAQIEPLSIRDGRQRLPLQQRVVQAGFSRDRGLGQQGVSLTYHRDCRVTAHEPRRVATNCLAFKGASGGPLLQDGEVVGVLSAGDSAGLSYYIPREQFVRAVERLRR